MTKEPSVIQWLREQERTIVPPWISAVQRASLPFDMASGSRTKQMESAQLLEFFDGIVDAVQTKSYRNLDAAIQILVSDRLGRGYKLTDFIDIADQLKGAIWQAAETSLPADQALRALITIEPIFTHSKARLAWLASRAAEAQLEEELERMRYTLAKLDRTKSDFISIAAHELKTPLTLIQGYTAILVNELNQHPALKVKGILQGLTSGIKRLHTLIQDMIDVSLIDSEVLTLSWQPVSLNEIVCLAVQDVKREASNRHVLVQVGEFPKETSAMYLDSKRLYQVFINLISNAIKYTPDDGTVTVNARLLHDPEQGLAFAEVILKDTGIGIAPDDLPHIFKKFYRVGETELHSTSKTRFKGGGPGLGLSIAKGIIEAHGGRIWAESPGYDEERCPGSTFYVMLPVYHELPENIPERLLDLE